MVRLLSEALTDYTGLIASQPVLEFKNSNDTLATIDSVPASHPTESLAN